MSLSAIEWTDRTWNPVTGCTKVSQGCKHCYAESVAARFFATQYRPVLVNDPTKTIDTVSTSHHEYLLANRLARPRRFTDVQTHADRLAEPLRWRKPTKIFVNSMSDLFHEAVPFEFVDRVFAVMALAPRHTFQILTKRPARMREYLTDPDVGQRVAELAMSQTCRGDFDDASDEWTADEAWNYIDAWPLRNVWLGVSVEDQAAADTRIPVLIETPAAVRFVSYEPALGPVDFRAGGEVTEVGHIDWLGGFAGSEPAIPRLDWVIVGGESGPGARPFDIAWARCTVAQCRAAGVPVFVKQMGANSHGYAPEARDFVTALVQVGGFITGKGGDPAEWPEDLRVREFPR